jgi:hypothetical protein
MHIRLSLSTLCASAAAVVWAAHPAAHVATTGRIEGTVTVVSPGGRRCSRERTRRAV